MSLLVAITLFLGVASSTREDPESLRSTHFKKWRQNPKMVVFGDSASDAGRRFDAPASFDFDGIGPFPWKKLFEEPDSDSTFRAYLPSPGSPTNGKVWPLWLRVPEELNFATSSASATEAFRSRERCGGYTGDGEDYPTATLEEQITRYCHEILHYSDETLDYTHIVFIGANEPSRLLQAVLRYTLGGVGYVDPVAFENVFELKGQTPSLTFGPMVMEVVAAWQEGITTLVERGVTGRILLVNLPSTRAAPGLDSELAKTLDLVALQVRAAAEAISQAIPQVRVLDLYSFSAALVDTPEVFQDLGFTGGSGSSMTEPCLSLDFFIDDTPEIVGTQAGRAEGCREQECALCADGNSPCQNFYEGNPPATVCDDPETRIFWDGLHFTTEVHRILGEAIRQCSKDEPNYDRAWVELLCRMEL
ncbi:unnamed protein product [Laminaria digitata]